MKKISRLAKRKFKLVSSELKMLQAYKIDMSLLLEDYTSEYLRDISFIKKSVAQDIPSPDQPDKKNVNPDANTLIVDPNDKVQEWKKTEDGWEKTYGSNSEESKDPSKPEDIGSKPEAPAWAKRLYKKIAMISHPDRTIGDHREKKLSKIFRDCAHIMSEGNFNDLLGYALELDIDVDDNTDALPIMSERVKSLKKEIEDIQKSIEWLWGECLDIPVMRLRLAKSALASEGLTVNTDDLSHIMTKLREHNAGPGNDC